MNRQEFVTITGATGHIGGRAAELLLGKGLGVRVVGRDNKRLQHLVSKGAEAFVGDMADPAAAERAFTGARAVFAMIPPNVTAPDVRADQNRFADSFVEAIRRAGVTHVVALSSVGAHRGTDMGPVNGLNDWEKKLASLSGVDVLILRPAYFMENLLMNVGLIKEHGIMGSALRPDLRFAAIATRDIADAAADALRHPTFTGHNVRELHGQRDITMEEARVAISTAAQLQRLAYVQFPYADAEKAMVGMGLSPDYARLIIEMNRSMNEGIMKPSQIRDAGSTTKTTIEEFSRTVIAPALKG